MKLKFMYRESFVFNLKRDVTARKKMNGILNGFKRVYYLNAFIRV